MMETNQQAITAAREGMAVSDRSHWGLLEIRGSDRLRYLHNQTTNDLEKLSPGEGCETVFVNSTARTIDLATAYVTEESVLLLVSPQRREQLMTWMDKYIFPMDRVEIKDISDEYGVLSLIGPLSIPIFPDLVGKEEKNHQLVKMLDIEVRIAVGTGLGIPGYTMIVPKPGLAVVWEELWQELLEKGAIPLSDRGWEQLRIEQGRPAPDSELTEDYNPLEAGLWRAIAFDKGCYIGQETIARLNTYKGVKQRLWGVKLGSFAEPGTVITVADQKVGILTSAVETELGIVGLAYIRTKAGGEGLEVKVGETSGEIIKVPFIRHDYY